MTDNYTAADLDAIKAPVHRAADMIGQATAIEQARAVAEVQAAIVVAQQCPRDLTTAIEQMRQSCTQRALADRAFFRYSRAGSQISGPSIHIARELARCWGNLQYGIAELRRDDDEGVSEMQAFAWDVQTNTRSASIFIVPHARDTKKGRTKITDLRDVYENNANQGARRVREAIFAILPTWFTEEAKTIAMATLEKQHDGKSFPQIVADTVTAFADLRVTKDQLEQKLGRKTDQWTGPDLAQLRVIYTSLKRGEITREDEFEQQRVTVGEIGQNFTQKEAPAPQTNQEPEGWQEPEKDDAQR